MKKKKQKEVLENQKGAIAKTTIKVYLFNI